MRGELFAQRAKCPSHVRFHGLNGDVQDSGNFPVGQPVLTAQLEDVLTPLREIVDGVADGLLQLLAIEQFTRGLCDGPILR